MIKKLSQKKFLETFKYSPRVALNILIINKKGEVLLTKRAIEPEKGHWHYPGGFILRGERLNDCFKRIAKKELGISLDPKRKKLVRVVENINGDIRGHIIDLMYEYKVSNNIKFKPNKETLEAIFFDKLPPNMGFNHKRMLDQLG